METLSSLFKKNHLRAPPEINLRYAQKTGSNYGLRFLLWRARPALQHGTYHLTKPSACSATLRCQYRRELVTKYHTRPQTSLNSRYTVYYYRQLQNLSATSSSRYHGKKQIVVIDGDHSCAIGTWSGVYSALAQQIANPQLGLIWIDAHMDSHTMATSPSGAIHGMPVASLLGHGETKLCRIASNANKIQPANLCLIGIRSFEPAEAQLLNKLGVKVFYMKDIHEHGFQQVFEHAKTHVTQNSDKYGCHSTLMPLTLRMRLV